MSIPFTSPNLSPNNLEFGKIRGLHTHTHSSIFSADLCLRVLRWLKKEEEEVENTKRNWDYFAACHHGCRFADLQGRHLAISFKGKSPPPQQQLLDVGFFVIRGVFVLLSFP